MHTITQITQPQPCHEPWAGMSVTDKGRFCSSCSKSVIDFTSMTNQQIIDHLSAPGGNVCGRIYAGQFEAINTQLSIPQAPKAGLWKRMMLALALFSFVQQAKAQAPVSKAQTLQSQFDKITVGEVMIQTPVAKDVTLTGRVVDKHGKPLAGVTVTADKRSALTDAAGNFRLKVPSGTHFFQIKHIGYQTETLKLGNMPLKAYYIKMETAGIYLGGIGAIKRPNLLRLFFDERIIKPVRALIG